MVTEEKSRIYTKNQRESVKSKKKAGSGISMKNLYSEKRIPDAKRPVKDQQDG